jgi:hypothetical protein
MDGNQSGPIGGMTAYPRATLSATNPTRPDPVRTRATAVESQRLTARDMAQPTPLRKRLLLSLRCRKFKTWLAVTTTPAVFTLYHIVYMLEIERQMSSYFKSSCFSGILPLRLV